MYLQYFGLNEPPFSITPDPRFVYLSPRHEDALAHLQYGISQGGSGGFIQLTGEVGTGKTTLCRTLLEQLPDNARVALILNPALQPVELLEAICQEFKISLDGARGSQRRLVDRLNEFLLRTYADGNTAVLLIDEAQNLSPESLEQVRLLTNLETETRKLLQIILLGQPELRDVLARPDLRQLAQRVTARFHLTPLSAPDTAGYIDHRMTVGGSPTSPFNPSAHRALHRQSGGIPRLINIIAERALLAAYAAGRHEIGAGLVNAAAREVRGHLAGPRRWPRWAMAAAVVVAALVMVRAGVWQWQQSQDNPIVSASEVDPMTNAEPAKVNPETASPITIVPPAVAAITPADPSIDPLAGRSVDGPTDPVAMLASSFAAAWAQLVAQRGMNASAATPGECAGRIDPGLYCLTRRGALAELVALNRPLLLQLTGEQFIVVTADANGAIGWADQPVPLEHRQLTRQWTGRYLDLWVMPGYVPQVSREGERGPGVLWIKQRAAVLGYAGDAADPYFDPALSAWATEFQQRSGVRADGLIGPQTLQHLTAAFERVSDNPRLTNGMTDVNNP